MSQKHRPITPQRTESEERRIRFAPLPSPRTPTGDTSGSSGCESETDTGVDSYASRSGTEDESGGEGGKIPRSMTFVRRKESGESSPDRVSEEETSETRWINVFLGNKEIARFHAMNCINPAVYCRLVWRWKHVR